MSAAAIRGDVMTRVRRVVERGDVAWPEERHYELESNDACFTPRWE
jgi:hypothetical protein